MKPDKTPSVYYALEPTSKFDSERLPGLGYNLFPTEMKHLFPDGFDTEGREVNE